MPSVTSRRDARRTGAWPARAAALVLTIGVGTAPAQTLLDPNLSVQTVQTGLGGPTGLRFLGNNPNDYFVIGKSTGQVVRYTNGTPTTVLDLNVASSSERGLLGIALSPDFNPAGGGSVYLYYSLSNTGGDNTAGGGWAENRLSRFTWNGTTLSAETTLRTFGTSAEGQANGPNHDGGPIRIVNQGGTNYIFGATGDLNRIGIEQNESTTTSARAGGIYRLNLDGSIPGDNPFAANANADVRPWYAYGVRNSFGLAVDTATNRLWDTENGPGSYDEINLLSAGANSGWTRIMGPVSRDGEGTGDLVNLAGSSYMDPEFSFLQPVGITSLEFLHGLNYHGIYDSMMFAGDNNTGQLYGFTLNAGRDGFVLTGGNGDLVADDLTERNALVIGSGFGVTTDLIRGPDGFLYVLSFTNNGGTLYRIVPEPGTVALWAVAGLAGAGFAVSRRRRRAGNGQA